MAKAGFGTPPHSSRQPPQIIKAAPHPPQRSQLWLLATQDFQGGCVPQSRPVLAEPMCSLMGTAHAGFGAMAGVLLTQFRSDSNGYACLETHAACARPCESFGAFLETQCIFRYVLV